MKTFKEFLAESADTPNDKPDHDAMRDFVYHGMENTDKDHDTLKKEFVDKFGKHNVKHFNKHVSKFME